MTFAEGITIARDIATIIAAGVAAYVGIRGLNTWRRQLSANTDNQTAKNVLAEVYQLRDLIEAIRLPLKMFPTEPNLPKEQLEGMSRRQREWRARGEEYQRLWEPVSAARVRLRTNLWEAEAIWGKEIIRKVAELFGLVNRLRWAIETHLDESNPENEGDPPDGRHESRREILFSHSGKEDEYQSNLEKAILDIEKELTPRIVGRKV